MRKLIFRIHMLSLATFCGLILALASCASEDVVQNGAGTADDKNLTIFSTGEDPATRTTMESNGAFYWEAGDKIWVKDDNGTWQQSSNSPTGKTASFLFKVPGTYEAKMSYDVYYSGKNGNKDQVNIPASQTQTEPNTTVHFGVSGDCGMAIATRLAGERNFNFRLDHEAAYLLFLPRTSNTMLQSCYLTKIEVNSDNDITSTYTLNPVTGKLTGTGTGNQIVLTTKGESGSVYQNGFPLTNEATNATTNGAYAVIKPGTHILRIRYWVKDVVTGTEGTITKDLTSANYEPNKLYNITANLDVRDYDGDHYYMWDAKEQYWAGHGWQSADPWQPVLNGNYNLNFPKEFTDLRYWRRGGLNRFDATQSCAGLLNANEMSWYVMYGDPRWDADELWTTMGRLYKGGMWFKKKSVLVAEGYYDTEKSADMTTDLRESSAHYDNNNSSIMSGVPSVADIAKYFYLPCLGYYNSGQLAGVGTVGYYWSSTSDPDNNGRAYYLWFLRGFVQVYPFHRGGGYRVQAFE